MYQCVCICMFVCVTLCVGMFLSVCMCIQRKIMENERKREYEKGYNVNVYRKAKLGIQL